LIPGSFRRFPACNLGALGTVVMWSSIVTMQVAERDLADSHHLANAGERAGSGAGMEPLAAGDPWQVGVYRLRFRLGAGGMGRVFLGFSPAGRAVAVKIVHPELARDPEFLERFRREVRAAEAVSGAYTAPVVAAGPHDDPPWLATVFVVGPSLADVIEQAGPLPQTAVWRLVGGLIEALQAVHACGLVHRDLKPTNVLLAADGPRVIDFGISRALEGTALTASSMIVGTPAFMSPEQVQGSPAGLPSDVFALGSVIAFAATGAAPFGSGDLVATAYRIVHTQPDLGGMPLSLRNLVVGCLAKAAGDRPPLTQLLEVVMAESAFDPAVSAGDFWPEPVAGLISQCQGSFRAQVTSRATSGPAEAMSSLMHEPTAPAWADSDHGGEEATRTAAGLSRVNADPLADRHGLPTRESALEKPGSARRVESSIKRVPRTEAEQQQLLRERPYPWEYFYFAARLLHERNSIESKYRDHLRGHAAPGGAVIANYQDFAVYVDKAMRDAQQLMGEVPRVWSSDAQEHAFGAPGEDGDAEAIERLAKSMNGIYEGLMDWAAKVRGVNRSSEFGRYFDLLSSINDSSISVYRKFVDDLVGYDDELPARIAAGEPSVLDMNIRFAISAETMKALDGEFARVGAAELGRIAGDR
jgi:serine/threonine protein kinase